MGSGDQHQLGGSAADVKCQLQAICVTQTIHDCGAYLPNNKLQRWGKAVIFSRLATSHLMQTGHNRGATLTCRWLQRRQYAMIFSCLATNYRAVT